MLNEFIRHHNYLIGHLILTSREVTNFRQKIIDINQIIVKVGNTSQQFLQVSNGQSCTEKVEADIFQK